MAGWMVMTGAGLTTARRAGLVRVSWTDVAGGSATFRTTLVAQPFGARSAEVRAPAVDTIRRGSEVHLHAVEGEPELACCADVLSAILSPSHARLGARAELWLRRYPGCLVAAAGNAEGRTAVRVRGGGGLEAVGPPHAAVLGSFVHAWLVAGASLGLLHRVGVDVRFPWGSSSQGAARDEAHGRSFHRWRICSSMRPTSAGLSGS
ncbi:hypothetical protein [Streptomyces xiaopingdaonensis]|uniref:hypothetical protein n=1 Tax=Streptomyces xiaopingdaonensis TaxID=1565415 RepID=UPI0004945350|nr:hypothetical protein [Streptomyces xiaopingdaonensis]